MLHYINLLWNEEKHNLSLGTTVILNLIIRLFFDFVLIGEMPYGKMIMNSVRGILVSLRKGGGLFRDTV